MKSNYIPLDQKPYCCVPACICMILDRRKITHGTQEEIGYELGLTVPKEKAHLFTKVRTGKMPSAGFGTQVNKKKYSINAYFKRHHIPLEETYIPASTIKNIKKIIVLNVKNNNDIIVCFNNKKLYGMGDWGHVSLVQDIDDNTIILIDPERGVPKKRRVNFLPLKKALQYHGEKRRGGLWIIHERT